jgi:pimeloyl-ACP methyl ester carboxylesterase
MKRGIYIIAYGIGALLANGVLAENSPSMLNYDQNALESQASRYGAVINTNENHIKGAILEHVLIYPKEHDHSSATITRKGILVRYPEAVATVLICHGFMCDKFDVNFLRNMFPKNTYNVMTFDFRAHGELTKNQYCTLGKEEALDVIAAAHFLREHPNLKGKPVFVYGFSMGAVASIEAQAKDNSLFDAMILDCPFDSSEKVMQRSIANLKMSVCGYEFEFPCKEFLQQYAFHPYVQALIKTLLKAVANMDTRNIAVSVHPVYPQESAKKISAPCLFVHCKNDEKVPVEAVMKVFEGTTGYKKLLLTNGRRHFDSYFYNPEDYVRRINKFLTNVVAGTLDTKVNKQKIIEDKEDIHKDIVKEDIG